MWVQRHRRLVYGIAFHESQAPWVASIGPWAIKGVVVRVGPAIEEGGGRPHAPLLVICCSRSVLPPATTLGAKIHTVIGRHAGLNRGLFARQRPGRVALVLCRGLVSLLVLVCAVLAQTPLTTAEIAKRVSPAVVVIQGKTDTGDVVGSGFIVSQDGKIVTNLHVIRNLSSAKVLLKSGRTADLVSVRVKQFEAPSMGVY